MKKVFSGESVILRFARFVTGFFYAAVCQGIFGRIFSSYDRVNDRFSASAVGRLGTGNGRLRRTVRQNVALAMETNAVVRALRWLRDRILLCGLRTVGLFFLIAGGYSLIVYWLIEFVWRTGTASLYHLICGVIAAVIGILLLFSEFSIGYALQHGVFCKRVLMTALDLSDESLKQIPRNGVQYYAIAVPAGMLIGAASALFNPLTILVVALWLILIFIELSVPEAGVLLLFFLVPFAGFLPAGELLITVAVLLPLLGYLVKLVRGNRAFRLEIQDLPVLLLLLMFCLSSASFASDGAVLGALRMALLAAVYLLVVNTLATPGWTLRCRIALLLSGAISAAVGILQFILAVAAGIPASDAVHAGFTDAVTFSGFLVLAYPFALYTLAKCRRQYRLPVACAVLLIAAGSVLSTVQSAAVAVLFMSAVFLLLCDRRFLLVELCAVGLLAVLRAILPGSILTTLSRLFMEETATASVSRLFAGGVSGAGVGSGFSRLLFGLGHGGAEEFSRMFSPQYPVITPQTTALFPYLLANYGLLALLALCFLLFFLVQNSFTVLSYDRHGTHRQVAAVGVSLVVGVLIHASFHYTWYDPAAMTFFFAALALVTAELRQERTRHARLEVSRNDSSSVEFDYYMNE